MFHSHDLVLDVGAVVEVNRLRKPLAELLRKLHSHGDPGTTNLRLRETLSSISVALTDKLPGERCSREEFCTEAVDTWFRVNLPLSELHKALVRDNPQWREAIDRFFRPALADLAFQTDGVPVPADLYRVENLLALIKPHAVPGSALEGWLVEHAPGVSQRTPDLPPVLFLVLSGNRVTSASVRIVGVGSRELALPETPGAPPGIDVGSGADLVRAVRDLLLKKSGLISTQEVVLVIEADPTAVALCPHATRVPGTDHQLERWLTAVAWWPQIEGCPVEGCIYDEELPAPREGSSVASWDQIPEDPDARQRACLGVWAAPRSWSTDSECKVLGRHDRRYFAVLADTALPELIRKTHPSDARATLGHLFHTIRGHARLVWTDRRYVIQQGVHIP